MANLIATHSVFAVKMVKTAMNKGTETDLETASLFEIDCFALCSSTPDQKEKMTTFAKKRKYFSYN